MHVAAAEAVEVTQRVRIVYDDGSMVECDITPVLAKSIARLERSQQRSDQKHRKRCKAATDIGTTAESWWRTRRDVPRRGPAGGVMHLGEGAVWSGPHSQWLTADGRVCGPRDKHAKCRFCGHLEHFPPNGVCYNDGCTRERRNRMRGG